MKTIESALAIPLVALPPLVAQAGEAPGFRYDGRTFEGQFLPPALRQSLFELEVQLNAQREQIFTQFVIEKYLAERAEAEGKTAGQMQAQFFDLTPPDEAALRAFYDKNKDRTRPAPPLEGAVADVPASCQLDLVQMPD